MKKILIVDLTDFFGGGQKFILSLFSAFQKEETELYAIVKCKALFEALPSRYATLLVREGLVERIQIINKLIESHHIEKVILNGNAVIYLAPFIRCKHKIAYKHTSNNAFYGIRRLLGPILLNFSYLFCQHIVLLFNNAKKEVFCFNKKKVSIIHNGINMKKYVELKQPADSKRIVLGMVSRIEKNKGLEWLLDLFIREFAHNEHVELRIAGDGSLMSLLKKKVENSEAKNVLFEGFLYDIDSFLTQIDVFILPSKFETFPLSILEAMNAALPIIATNTGGVSEMVKNNYNGFLIRYKDDAALLDALKYFIANPDCKVIFGSNSKVLLKERFTIETQVLKIQQL